MAKRKLVRKAEPASCGTVAWFGTTNTTEDPYWHGYSEGRKAGVQDAITAAAKLLAQMGMRPTIDPDILVEFDANEDRKALNRRLSAIEAKLK